MVSAYELTTASSNESGAAGSGGGWKGWVQQHTQEAHPGYTIH